MEITKWIRDGNHSLAKQGVDSTKVLLEAAGRLLDKACSSDIIGDCLFEGADGKTYVGTVEFVISEADEGYVKSVLEDEDED